MLYNLWARANLLLQLIQWGEYWEKWPLTKAVHCCTKCKSTLFMCNCDNQHGTVITGALKTLREEIVVKIAAADVCVDRMLLWVSSYGMRLINCSRLMRTAYHKSRTFLYVRQHTVVQCILQFDIVICSLLLLFLFVVRASTYVKNTEIQHLIFLEPAES